MGKVDQVSCFDIYCPSVSLLSNIHHSIHHSIHGKLEVVEVAEVLHGDGDRGGRRPPRGLMEPCGSLSARAGQKDLIYVML